VVCHQNIYAEATKTLFPNHQADVLTSIAAISPPTGTATLWKAQRYGNPCPQEWRLRSQSSGRSWLNGP
jgi:hypothetical protein